VALFDRGHGLEYDAIILDVEIDEDIPAYRDVVTNSNIADDDGSGAYLDIVPDRWHPSLVTADRHILPDKKVSTDGCGVYPSAVPMLDAEATADRRGMNMQLHAPREFWMEPRTLENASNAEAIVRDAPKLAECSESDAECVPNIVFRPARQIAPSRPRYDIGAKRGAGIGFDEISDISGKIYSLAQLRLHTTKRVSSDDSTQSRRTIDQQNRSPHDRESPRPACDSARAQ
jgi:hypothetical protein